MFPPFIANTSKIIVCFVALLVDADGREIAAMPPRVVTIDLENRRVKEAEGFTAVLHVISQVADDQCYKDTDKVFNAIRKRDHCIGGCGMRNPVFWSYNTCCEALDAFHSPTATTEPRMEVTSFWGGVCGGIGSVCWKNAGRIISFVMNEKYRDRQKINNPDNHVFMCAMCMKHTVNRDDFKRCGRCRAAHYCGIDCQRKHYPEHKLFSRPYQELNAAKWEEEELDGA